MKIRKIIRIKKIKTVLHTLYFLTIITFLLNCNNHQYQPINIKNPCSKGTKTKPFGVIFETNFDHDTVEVMVGDRSYFNKVITTNEVTYWAGSIGFDTTKISGDLKIIINKKEWLIKPICKRIIRINYLNDTLFVEFADKAWGPE